MSHISFKDSIGELGHISKQSKIFQNRKRERKNTAQLYS